MRNLGSARATTETYRDMALGAKLVIYNRVPVCPLHCARFASAWEGRIEAPRAESQWIVAASPICHLQYPVVYLSRLQRILPDARWEFVQGVPWAHLPLGVHQRHAPLGAEASNTGRQTDGGRTHRF
ncbi:Regulator of rDNA transcription protein 15 [Senna tora]|uniref:Regulator of rDNA transcription protein 15 n=1 Tax=Senna tora TaxID=362788 RepID=A0A834TGY9_9FABA|nr:Regulator of rDNA transcription protein 15 [Senna tora]